MSYYKGDFYGRGGYYRGDPGFFSFLGGAAKGLLGAIPGVGPIISSAVGALTAPKASSAIVKSGAMTATKPGFFAGATAKVGSMIKGHPILSAAGAAGLAAAAGGGAAMALRGAGGKKLSTLALTGVRKRRRMNPTNPSALRRAIRRATGFERLAKKVLGFSSPRKPRGHMYFKRKRKR